MRNLRLNNTLIFTLLVFLLSLVPPAGLVAAAFAKRLRHAWFFAFWWLLLWLGFGVPLALHQLLLGRGSDALALAGQSLLAFLVASLFSFIGFGFNASRLKSRAGGAVLVALALLVASGFAERRLSTSIWQNPDKAGLVATLRSLGEDTITSYGVRAWSIPSEPPHSASALGETLTLSLEARLLAGDTAWDWVRSDASFELTPLQEAGEVFTRVVTPTGPDPYLMRTFDLGEPVGGHTFKVALELRAPQPIPAEGCRGVWLQVWYEGGDATCLAVALNTTWAPFSLEWTAPEAATSSVVRVILNNFDGLSYDVRRVKLYMLEQGAWERLGPLVPQGASVQFGWKGHAPEPQSGTAFVPTRDWTHYTFTTTKPASATGPLTATLRLGSGQTGNDHIKAVLQTRRTALFSSASPQAAPQQSASQQEVLRPVPVQARQSLFFGHPNLAGHTLVTLGLVALSLVRTGWLGALALGLAVGGVWLTGSRAAWLSALVGLPWLLLLGGSKRRVWMVGGLVTLGALFLGVFGLQGLGRLRFVGVAEVVSRPQIWRVALDAFLDQPWRGLGAGGFAANWAVHAQPDLVVTHAHNLWLQFAAAYGFPGLVAVLWLTGGFLYLAWRWGRWRGLALVVPVFVMNIFDYTFFYSGVLFPLLLGMNALREERADALQATTPPPAAKEA